MANINPVNPVENSSNQTQIDQPQPAAHYAEGEATSGPSPVRAEAETAHGSFPTTGPGNQEPIRPVPVVPFQQSSRVWRSGDPYYPSPHRDGNHWKKVHEKVDQFDKEFCGGWNGEIDSLLTFAGLFSAVVTAFTIESYKLLQPDPQDMTNYILLNLTAQLAGRNSPIPESFTPSPSSLRINVLWFLSLTFSLAAGLVGILCKQWLRHYQQDISKPPKEALAMRQFRYEALLRCRVMEILSALPILLGLGLILFFAGLIDFLRGLNAKVAIPVTILAGVGFAFLVVTTLTPAFQYIGVIRRYYFGWYTDRPAPFAFKSPQSLAILHLVTWLFPLSADLKGPDWASLELKFFAGLPALRTYTGRALTWLDETYSHSMDMARRICLCLQDVEDEVLVEGPMDEDMLHDFSMERSSAAVIKSFFNATWRPGTTKAEGHVRRDIIAMRYLRPKIAMSFDQCFIVLEHLIRALNFSQYKTPSLWPFIEIFDRLQHMAHGPVEQRQLEEVIWQRGVLFRNLLSERRWTDSTRIPIEVWNIFKNINIFTDGDLNSIFNPLCAWMDQPNPESSDLPSHCWVLLTSRFAHHELEALRRRPPARDFMAFLDLRFQMDDGVKHLCSKWYYYGEEAFNLFFKALDAWITQNPQNTQSFIHCRTLLATMDSYGLRRARRYRSFRHFEALLEARISRNEDVGEQGPVRDP